MRPRGNKFPRHSGLENSLGGFWPPLGVKAIEQMFDLMNEIKLPPIDSLLLVAKFTSCLASFSNCPCNLNGASTEWVCNPGACKMLGHLMRPGRKVRVTAGLETGLNFVISNRL